MLTNEMSRHTKDSILRSRKENGSTVLVEYDLAILTKNFSIVTGYEERSFISARKAMFIKRQNKGIFDECNLLFCGEGEDRRKPGEKPDFFHISARIREVEIESTILTFENGKHK